jgi:general secretion pathway protein F
MWIYSVILMKNFKYIVLNANGKKINGTIAAQSEQAAKDSLKAQGFIVLNLQVGKAKFQGFQAKPKTQDICLFTRQLATLLSAGIPLSNALEGVAAEQNNSKMKELILGIHQKVLEGYSLAQALKQYPEVFSTLYCSTIYAGEQSGKLDKILEQLANYIEQQHFAKQKIQQALIYPTLMITISFLIVFFLMTNVVPQILSIFDDNQQQLPFITKILIFGSHFFKIITPYILLVLLGAGYFVYHKRHDLAWKRKFHQYVLKIKFYPQFIKMTQIPRYLHTLRILLISGVNILESMSVGSQLISNLIIRDAFEQATQKVKEGMAISSALKSTNWFSSMTIHLIQSGEKSGQIALMMERAAEQIDLERQQLTDTGLKLLEPIIILIMGGFVLFIVLAILLPIFQMQQLV